MPRSSAKIEFSHCLVCYGFDAEAREMAEKTITLFGEDSENHGALHEHYEPDTGEPIMNKGFQNWKFWNTGACACPLCGGSYWFSGTAGNIRKECELESPNGAGPGLIDSRRDVAYTFPQVADLGIA
jgi:hypothetical protein